MSGPNLVTPPSVYVALLYLTNNIDRNQLEGVFRLDNRLDDDVFISGSNIESFNGTNWTFLTTVSMRRFDRSVDIRFPGGLRFLFQTWVPDKGGLYRLVLYTRMHPNIRTNTDIPSPAFRVSDGPPITQIDFVVLSPYSSDVRSLVNLSNQITNADRIVLTNSLDEYPGFSDSISGDRMRRIMNAVSSAKRMNAPSDSAWEWQLQFYKGTNFLASVNFEGSSFVIGTEEYSEESGVLDNLYDEVSDKERKRMREGNQSN